MVSPREEKYYSRFFFLFRHDLVSSNRYMAIIILHDVFCSLNYFLHRFILSCSSESFIKASIVFKDYTLAIL